MSTLDSTTLDWLGRHAAATIRAMIDHDIGGRDTTPADARSQGASFVTLRQAGRLRGCMGTLTATKALCEDVRANAIAAASRDPRFAPLETGELTHTDVSVSILSPPQVVACRDRKALLQTLGARREGVIVHHRLLRATFLPEVWNTLPNAAAFVDALLEKAGIAADTPFHALRFECYATRHSSGVPLAAG